MAAVYARLVQKVPGIFLRPQGSFNFCSRPSCSLPASARTQYPSFRPGRVVAPMARRKSCQKKPSTLCSTLFSCSGWATSTTPHSTPSDPADLEALRCLELGTQKLEEGDVETAKRLYKKSTEIKRNASSLFNLGVTHYHLSASSPTQPPNHAFSSSC